VTASAAPKYPTIDEAIARGDLADVKLHLAADPGAVNQGKSESLTPLNQAIMRKQEAIALQLIASGADVNAADNSQRTPLHLSVDRDLPTVVAALLAAEAKPHEWDKAGWTPLHNATAKDRIAVAEALIEGGANVNFLSERKGTPLHEAAASASAEIVERLLEAGVDPTVIAFDGGTALDVAIAFENVEVIPILNRAIQAAPASDRASSAGTMEFDPTFTHVVYFWLKNPDSLEDRQQFEAAARTFMETSQYAKTRFIGVAPKATREVVDDSFTYSLILTFESADAQAKYQQEPAHDIFVAACKPLWEKVIVYDSTALPLE
jgi:hypothetical protein